MADFLFLEEVDGEAAEDEEGAEEEVEGRGEEEDPEAEEGGEEGDGGVEGAGAEFEVGEGAGKIDEDKGCDGEVDDEVELREDVGGEGEDEDGEGAEIGDKEAHVGGAGAGGAGKEGREEAVFGGCEGDLAAGEDPGVQSADAGNESDDGKRGAPLAAEEDSCGVDVGGLCVGEGGGGNNAHNPKAVEKVDGGDNECAGDDGAGDGFLGVVDDGGGSGRSLKADKTPKSHEARGVEGRKEIMVVGIEGKEVAGLEEKEGCKGDDEEGGAFQDGEEDLQRARGGRSTHINQGNESENADF